MMVSIEFVILLDTAERKLMSAHLPCNRRCRLTPSLTPMQLSSYCRTPPRACHHTCTTPKLSKPAKTFTPACKRSCQEASGSCSRPGGFGRASCPGCCCSR